MKLKPFFVSLTITSIVGYAILVPPSAFNLIPFGIHQSFFRNTSIQEHHFIIGFDALILAVLFIGIVKILRRKN